MPHLPTWRRYFRVMPPGPSERIDEELRFHFEARVDELVTSGLPRDAARARVLEEFGDLDRVTADLRVIDARIDRATRRSAWLSGVGQDVRVAWRSAVRAPTFTLVVVATFALGIGANTVIFSLLSGVLLRPLPYQDPEALAAVWLQHAALGRERAPLSAAEVLDLRTMTTTVAAVEALQANVIPTSLTIQGTAVAVQMVRVSPGMFRLLGRSALLGRVPTHDPQEVVISHGFWQRQFGGDPGVIGRSFGNGPRAQVIVGVMPPDFVFPFAPLLGGPVTFTDSAHVDIWTPLDLTRAATEPRTARTLSVLVRLREGVTVETATRDVAAAVQQLAAAHPDSTAGWTGSLVPLHELVVGPVRPALQLLFAAVCLVLLVACVNVANLLLSRASVRARELAMRAALGAGRARVLRQTLIESLGLALAGGVAGVLLARWATLALVSLAPPEIPRLQSVTVDWRVLAFTAFVIVLTGVLAGLAPAVAALGADVRCLLADGSRGTTPSRPQTLRGVLVAGEVALAVALTVGGVLLMRSLLAVLAVHPGFTTDRLLTATVTVPARHATPDARREFYRLLFERLENLPGVASVGGTTRLPLGGANSTTQIAVEGRVPAEGQWPAVDLRRALGRYFETMQIPIVRGRSFDQTDGPAAPPVAIVNETLARTLFAGSDPVGQRIRLGENAGVPAATVIGVVADIHHRSLEEPPAPEVYIHYLQNPPVAPFLVLRTTSAALEAADSVRAALHAFDPTLTVWSMQTMAALRLETTAERRFVTTLMAAFGAIALVLAGVGVYGVVALAVTERRREIGIRLALGATPADVTRRVVTDALRLGAVGVAAGLLLVLPLMPLLARQLFGVQAADPVTLGAVPIVMLVLTTVAALIPASRAVGIDAATTMRSD